MNRNFALWQLQALDQEIDDHSKRARQIDLALASDPAVANARATLEAEQKKLAESRALLRDSELDASSLDARIKDLNARLYGGHVTSPKELDSLDKDLQMHKRHRADLDDKLLLLMDSVEQSLRRVEEKALKLRTIEETRAGEVAQLTHEKESLVRHLGELDMQRDQTRTALDPDALRQYDYLRHTKAGRAVAQIKNSSCSICGVTVPSGLINRVRAGEEIVACSSCGRILAQ